MQKEKEKKNCPGVTGELRLKLVLTLAYARAYKALQSWLGLQPHKCFLIVSLKSAVKAWWILYDMELALKLYINKAPS